MYYWLDDHLTDENECHIPVGRGLWYGDGCFETLLVEHGKTYGLDLHLERLRKGMRYLDFPNKPDLDDRIQTGITEVLKACELLNKSARVRIQVWREGSTGFAPPAGAKVRLHIMASEVLTDISPINLATVSTRRITAVSVRSDLKLSSAVNYIRAAAEARQQGADEALMLTTNGHISETTIANIFWLIDDTVYTPSDDCDLLPGIIREAFMDWVQTEQNDLKLRAGQYTPDVLKKAEAVWLTNSVRLIQPVGRLDSITLNKSVTLMEKIRYNFRLFLAERYTTV